MILWLLLKPETQKAIRKAFPRFKPPKVEEQKEVVVEMAVKVTESDINDMAKMPQGR